MFARRVREVCDGNAALCAIAEPMLAVWQSLREQIHVLDGQLFKRAKADPATQRLMSIPAVGVIVALAYVAVIDNPERFRRSSTVGAYLGLTPRRYQSGDVDCAGRISKCGDGLLRAYLFQAANAILTRKVTTALCGAGDARWCRGSACVGPPWPWHASSPSSCMLCGRKRRCSRTKEHGLAQMRAAPAWRAGS